MNSFGRDRHDSLSMHPTVKPVTLATARHVPSEVRIALIFLLVVIGEVRRIQAPSNTPLICLRWNERGPKVSCYGCDLNQCGSFIVPIDGDSANACARAVAQRRSALHCPNFLAIFRLGGSIPLTKLNFTIQTCEQSELSPPHFCERYRTLSPVDQADTPDGRAALSQTPLRPFR